jgi:hypothetical protein
VVKTRPSSDGTVGDVLGDSNLPLVEWLPASLAACSRVFECHVDLNLSAIGPTWGMSEYTLYLTIWKNSDMLG